MTKSTGKHATKQWPCRECGELVTVGIRTYKQPRCLDCGIKAMMANMTQLKQKSGPLYDRWLMGCLGVDKDPLPGTGAFGDRTATPPEN